METPVTPTGEIDTYGKLTDGQSSAAPIVLQRDGFIEETFGSWDEVWSCQDGSRGNIYLIEKNVILKEQSFYLELDEVQELCFFVYKGASLQGNFTLENCITLSNQEPGSRFYSSGALNYLLEKGHYYYIGTAWSGSARYARGGLTAPFATSFGNLENAAPLTISAFPVEDAVEYSNEYLCSAYCQRLSTEAAPVTEEDALLADNHRLISVYPNPFNPTTNFKVNLNEAGNVSLSIYDVCGREVIRLMDGFHAQGAYNLEWDASTAPSGVYLARLEAGDYSTVQKLLLLK
jgi:hypothetical protein